MTGNVLLTSILFSIILGSLGARISGAAPWKGTVLAIAYLAAVSFAGLFTASTFLALITGVIAIGLIAAPMALKSQQSTNIALGCVLGQLAPILIMSGN